MDESLIGLMEILLPALLLVLLLWLAFRRRSTGRTRQTEEATDRLYDTEERRRRDGTDDL